MQINGWLLNLVRAVIVVALPLIFGWTCFIDRQVQSNAQSITKIDEEHEKINETPIRIEKIEGKLETLSKVQEEKNKQNTEAHTRIERDLAIVNRKLDLILQGVNGG
jgi:hypothetical protein